jgi:hypothetical protein
MVAQPTTNHARKPSSRFTDTLVAAAAKSDFDRCQCPAYSFATGTPQENKALVLSGLAATVDKTKELKRLAWLPAFGEASPGSGLVCGVQVERCFDLAGSLSPASGSLELLLGTAD